MLTLSLSVSLSLPLKEIKKKKGTEVNEKTQKQRHLFTKWKGRVLELAGEKAPHCHPLSQPLCSIKSSRAGIGTIRRKPRALPQRWEEKVQGPEQNTGATGETRGSWWGWGSQAQRLAVWKF